MSQFIFLYKKVQETSNVKYFIMLLTSLRDLVKSENTSLLSFTQYVSFYNYNNNLINLIFIL